MKKGTGLLPRMSRGRGIMALGEIFIGDQPLGTSSRDPGPTQKRKIKEASIDE